MKHDEQWRFRPIWHMVIITPKNEGIPMGSHGRSCLLLHPTRVCQPHQLYSPFVECGAEVGHGGQGRVVLP